MHPEQQLGDHTILSAIGKGGMGEVWRARDRKLGRDVAVKTLPDAFARDPDRVARFEHEARMLAALNHPNIASIYGLEESQGVRFLVLELVEGATLADRLKAGPIPLEEAVPLAIQIAEALEAAHDKGVIHRDLKPGNIMITPEGRVKVLDFGLAKAFGGETVQADASNSPTLSMAATQQGVILGPAAYMSPEQAKGRETDRRSDIWSFGCVLYEMLTGRAAFEGEDTSEILASVIKGGVNLQPVSGLHPRLGDLLAGCLEKDLRRRYRDIGDVRIELERIAANPAGSTPAPAAVAVRPPFRSAATWVAAGFVLAAFLSAVFWTPWLAAPVSDRAVIQFDHVLPAGLGFRNASRPVIALASDGSHFVYNTTEGLYRRAIGDVTARLISGTEDNLANPFLSPDHQWVGYFAVGEGQLKKIPISGGTAVTLCAATNPFGVDWSSERYILFGQPEGIVRVSADGGAPELVVAAKGGEQVYGPQLLPDGNTVLFSATTASGDGRWDQAEIVAASLNSGDRKVLLRGGSDARYVSSGHILYAVGDVLFAVAFDPSRLEVRGGPVPLVQGVRRATNPAGNTGSANYSVSDSGTVVYVGGSASVGNRILGLVDAVGVVQPLNARPAPYRSPRVSPDGRRLAAQTVANDGQGDVWIYDLDGNRSIRPLTQDGQSFQPAWTPDGKRVTFVSTREDAPGIYWQPADGTGVAERLVADEGTPNSTLSWSPDGRILAFSNRGGIWTVSPGGTPELFHDAPNTEDGGALFSPKGDWLAYYSVEAGRARIYVQPYPPTGVRQRLTQDGGAFPLWSPDGRQLYYRDPFVSSVGDRLMSMDVDPGPPFTFGSERTLPVEGFLVFQFHRDYDVTPDGRFVMVFPADPNSVASTRPTIRIVVNWLEELQQRVPSQTANCFDRDEYAGTF